VKKKLAAVAVVIGLVGLFAIPVRRIEAPLSSVVLDR